MTAKSPIEWTEHTWNPIVGCTIVSAGCINCYAMKQAGRLLDRPGSHYSGTTKRVNGNTVWTGKVAFAPDAIVMAPLKREKPTTYFVNSMGDVFHEDVPDEWIDRMFAVMALAPQHRFQVLTKRAKRMLSYLSSAERKRMLDGAIWSLLGTPVGSKINHGGDWKVKGPLPNVWLGVSAEDQSNWDERKQHLRETPAAVRFASFEPLLGAIVEPRPLSEFIDWAIVGGESGQHARPMHPQWARSLRDQCKAAGVAFFMKQWGEFLPVGQYLPGAGKVHGATAVRPGRMKLHYGGTPQQEPKHAFEKRGVDFVSTVDGGLTFRVGKRAAGRLLDGVEHNGMPR